MNAVRAVKASAKLLSSPSNYCHVKCNLWCYQTAKSKFTLSRPCNGGAIWTNIPPRSSALHVPYWVNSCYRCWCLRSWKPYCWVHFLAHLFRTILWKHFVDEGTKSNQIMTSATSETCSWKLGGTSQRTSECLQMEHLKQQSQFRSQQWKVALINDENGKIVS